VLRAQKVRPSTLRRPLWRPVRGSLHPCMINAECVQKVNGQPWARALPHVTVPGCGSMCPITVARLLKERALDVDRRGFRLKSPTKESGPSPPRGGSHVIAPTSLGSALDSISADLMKMFQRTISARPARSGKRVLRETPSCASTGCGREPTLVVLDVMDV
jgi:hypothetical protein